MSVIYNLCRICLTESPESDEMQPLFDETDERCEEIVHQIQECGGIVLTPKADYPKMICKNCLKNLDASYKFRVLCQTSENALLDILIKPTQKLKPKDIVVGVQKEIGFNFCTEFIEEKSMADLECVSKTKRPERKVTKKTVDKEVVTEVSEDSDYNETECNDDGDALLMEEDYIAVKSLTKKKAPKRGRPRVKDLPIVKPKKSPVIGVKQKRGRKKLDETKLTNIMCEICGNIYTKRSLLNMHMRRHLAEKPYECEICGKTFTCPSEISRHIRVHTGEKPYVCNYCGRSFADRSSNIKHERIHTNTRPFSCKTCGKSFTYSNVLKNHMLTHTGEKPFPCVPCNKTFSRKHQLDQHCSTITHQQIVKNFDINPEIVKEEHAEGNDTLKIEPISVEAIMVNKVET